MSEENDYLRPLSFDDENLNPSFQDEVQPYGFVPIEPPTQIQNYDSNFVFFFGVSASGKSVILSAILYYLKTKGGVLRPISGTPNTREAQVLLADFFENISRG
ncbi:MAG: hypothetical protein RSA74_10720, partial [Chryseobacterium sp.]